MATNDIGNNRHAADETVIGVGNVARLAPMRVLTTNGNNWATPVVADGRFFFPDSGGWLWAVDATTGEVLWSRQISEYNGISGSAVRTSAVYADEMIFLGDRGGANMIAIDAKTGSLVWITDLEEHPNAQVTGSPIVIGDRVYIGVSSARASEIVDGKIQSTFRGSLVALDIHTGAIVWRRYTIPDNDGAANSWSGGAVISSPAVDLPRGTIYFHGDHYYSQPDDVITCMAAAPNDWDPRCYPKDALANALIAADVETGTPKWTFLASGVDAYEIACGEIPSITFQRPVEHNRMCPPLGDWVNWGFAVGSPNLFRAEIGGVTRDLVGVAQKSGFYWTLEADTGEVVWVTWVGPFSEPGGLAQGGAFDGERIYVSVANLENTPHFVAQAPCPGGVCGAGNPTPGGAPPIWGGSWAALDPGTGEILWQTAEPNNARVYGSPVVANGVVFVGLDGCDWRPDVRPRRRHRRNSMEVCRRRLGIVQPCGGRRPRLLGFRLRAVRRRSKRQVLHLQYRRELKLREEACTEACKRFLQSLVACA